ncbi:sigma-70 family RNA polymerase sigma factor [Verrucomicrobiaceae bacterium 227]
MPSFSNHLNSDLPESPADPNGVGAELVKIQIPLRAYIGSLLGAPGDLGDVIQEVNLFAWERREEYKPDTNFKAWAFRIAYFKVLSHRRDLARGNKFVFNDQLLVDLAAEAQKAPEEEAIELSTALRTCLEKLPPNPRQLIEQHYLKGISLIKIAHRTKRKPMTVYKSISRIRALIRECVEKNLNSQSPKP